MAEVDDILTPLSIWLKDKRKIALATVISTWGSSPRPVGGQMAIDQNGEIIGSVSGGCIEGAVITEGIKSLSDGKLELKIMEFQMIWLGKLGLLVVENLRF